MTLAHAPHAHAHEDVSGGGLLEVEQADPILNPCGCVHRHAPVPESNDIHHVWPRGMGGPDTGANRMPLCPTAHDIVHRIIDDFVRHNGPTPVGSRNRYIYRIAMRGYNEWVAAGKP